MLTYLVETREEMLKDFDLSHLRSLRSLEVTASSVSHGSRLDPDLLRDIISTINSPMFSEVVLVFQRPDLYRPYSISFETFREMHSKRKFRLVFCLEVLKKYRNPGFQVMRQRMEYEMTQRRLNFLESPPTLKISEGNPWAG